MAFIVRERERDDGGAKTKMTQPKGDKSILALAAQDDEK